MTSETFDAIVVGAGPAGGTAAYFLGEAGKRVLVLEKERLPRYKPCGGGISSNVLKQFPFSFEPVIESRPQSIGYLMGGRRFRVPVPRGSLVMVMRDRFDAHLLRHAKAEVRSGIAMRRVREFAEHVEVETSAGDRHRASYLIGADGANSMVAHQIGLRRDRILAAAIEAEVPADQNLMQLFEHGPAVVFGEVGMGYLWVFPKADHLSVGIGVMRPQRRELKETLDRVMGDLGIRLDEVQLHGHPLPVHQRREKIATGRAMLVGDAAGLVDSFTGEGIRLAIKSGRLAAEAIVQGAPERYQSWVQRDIGRSQRLGFGIARLFYGFPRAAWPLAIRNPFATRAFVQLMSDRFTYRQILATLIGTLPAYALTDLASGAISLLGASQNAWRLRRRVFGAATPLPF